jgi:hypothetical protein
MFGSLMYEKRLIYEELIGRIPIFFDFGFNRGKHSGGSSNARRESYPLNTRLRMQDLRIWEQRREYSDCKAVHPESWSFSDSQN